MPGEEDGFKAGGVGGEILHPPPLLDKAGNVNLRGNQAGFKALLGQNRAVFGDEIVAGEYQVGGGFAISGAGVEVCRREPSRLSRHQLAAVGRLAEHLVAGREVGNHRGARQGQAVGRGIGHPEILADLHAQHEVGEFPAGEEQLGAEGHRLAAEHDFQGFRRGGGKVALFVELAVVGHVHLGYHAENLAIVQDGRAVIKGLLHGHGQSYGHQQLLAPGGVQHSCKGSFGAAKQRGLQKEVAAGVGGEPQLGQHQKLDAPGSSLLHQLDGGGGIFGAVGHLHLRGGHGNGDKSILHS